MKFSLKFVTYHGCGSCYVDGTNLIQSNSRLYFFPTHESFWKDPKDTSNKIARSTRNHLEKKTFATKSYCKRYFNHLRKIKHVDTTVFNQWTSRSEDSVDTYYSDEDESILNSNLKSNSDIKTENTIEKGEAFGVVNSTAPMIIINSENNVSNNELAGEDLIIDENQPNKQITN